MLIRVRFFALAGLILAAHPCLAQSQTPPAPENTRLIQSIDGEALYGAYCSVCHGKDGKGGGPMAQSLKTRPSDTRIAARNSGTFPMAKVEKIISGEQARSGGHGPREMPVWGPVFSQIAWDQDLGRVRVNNVARYLQKLQVR